MNTRSSVTPAPSVVVKPKSTPPVPAAVVKKPEHFEVMHYYEWDGEGDYYDESEELDPSRTLGEIGKAPRCCA